MLGNTGWPVAAAGLLHYSDAGSTMTVLPRPTHQAFETRWTTAAVPKVTAILPCYCAEGFISRTLDSLAAQTWPRLEILIGDDASTDGTMAIVAAFAQGRDDVRIIARTENLGWLANTNDLMAKASGELMFFAFHDDLVAPTYVERLVQALQHNPRAVIAYSDLELIEVDGSQQLIIYDGLSGGVSRAARAVRMASKADRWWVPNRGLFHADAFRRIAGIQRHEAGEFQADWPWLLHMATLGEFERVAEPLCRKFYLKTSISKNWNEAPADHRALLRSAIREIRRSDLDMFSKLSVMTYLRVTHQYPNLETAIPQPLKDVVKRLMH